MGRRNSSGDELHYHGHVIPTWSPSPELTQESFTKPLNGAHEVAGWLAGEMREAIGKPDLTLSDEISLWVRLASDRETITTGLPGGPTITAKLMTDAMCRCERPELHPVGN
jgi:hypothetical protein